LAIALHGDAGFTFRSSDGSSGPIGYAMVFTGLSEVITQFGISAALVQSQIATEKHLRAGLGLALSTGTISFALVYFFAPLVSREIPGEIRTDVLQTLALVFLVRPFAIVAEAKLLTALDYRKLFAANVASYLFGYAGVSITMAIHGYGVWSLIIGLLVFELLRCLLLFISAPYPLLPLFWGKEIRSILRFSFGIVLARSADYAAHNVDAFAVASVLGGQALGLYQRAYQTALAPIDRLSTVLSRVLFPLLSKVQLSDTRMHEAFLRAGSIATLVAAPIMGFTMVSSREIILVLYGDRWLECAACLSAFSAGTLFLTTITLTDAVMKARGLVYRLFGRYCFFACTVWALAQIGSRYSISAVAWGVAGATFIMSMISAQVCLKQTGATWMEFLRSQIPGLGLGLHVVCGAVLGGAIAELFSVNSPAILLCAKGVTAIAPVAVALLLFPGRWLGKPATILLTFMDQGVLTEKQRNSVLWNSITRRYCL
jgi:O-antigen/teichoic acid export membrane protein